MTVAGTGTTNGINRRGASSRILLPLRFGKKLWNSLSGGNPRDFTLSGRERTLRTWDQLPQTFEKLSFPHLRAAIRELHGRASNTSLPSYHYQRNTPQPWFDPRVIEAVLIQLDREVGVVTIGGGEGFYIPKPAREGLKSWRDGGKPFPRLPPGIDYIHPDGFISMEASPVEWDLLLDVELKSIPSDSFIVRLALLLGQDYLYLEESGRAFLSPRVSAYETYRQDALTRQWAGATSIKHRAWLSEDPGIPAIWSESLPSAVMASIGRISIGNVRSFLVEWRPGRFTPSVAPAMPTVQVVDWIVVVLLWEGWLDDPNPPDEAGGTFGLLEPKVKSLGFRVAADQEQALSECRWHDRCGHLGSMEGSRLVLRKPFRARGLLHRFFSDD